MTHVKFAHLTRSSGPAVMTKNDDVIDFEGFTDCLRIPAVLPMALLHFVISKKYFFMGFIVHQV